jgi:hypothetical protein
MRHRGTAAHRRAYFFFSLTLSSCVLETCLPRRKDWNVNVAVTWIPCFCLRRSVRDGDEPGESARIGDELGEDHPVGPWVE